MRGTRWGRRLTAACACALAVSLAGCGDDPVAPQDRLELQAESRHFRYYGAPGDEPVDTAYQERHLAWASERLGLEPRDRISYYKYRDEAHLVAVTGHDRGTGFAEVEAYRIHSVWTRDNHEYIHVLFNGAVGTPPPFFSEGVAVAHHGGSFNGPLDGSPLWNGVSVHGIARALRSSGELPSLGSLVAASGFYDHDGQVTYPVAGSFVRFLIDEEGIEAFKAFVERTDGPGDGAVETRRNLEAVYGQSLDALEDRWLAFLSTSSG